MPIFDQGYQHWNGQVSGQAWRWLVVTRHGVRTQLKNRMVRLLLLVAWVPALALVAFLAVWGLIEQKSQAVTAFFGPILSAGILAEPVTYRRAFWTLAYSYFFWTELVLIMLLVVAIGPGLISRDLRFNALPLYFSRPIRRFDYFLGKLGVIGALVAAVAVAPAVLAYVAGVCFSLDFTVIRDTYRLLLASIVYGLVITVSVGTLMLALSSLTRRSILVGIAWFGIWLIGGALSGVLEGIHEFSLDRQASAESTELEPAPPPPEGKKLTSVEKQLARQRSDQAQQVQRALRQQKIDRAHAEASRSDWRPLFSFRANLKRIGEWLLGSDAAWVELGRALDAPRRLAAIPGMGSAGAPINERILADRQVWQYPWFWSAGVLTGLCALSIWILTFRVKSLDRLK